MLPVISTYDSILPGTKNNDFFDNNSTPFDTFSSQLGTADYALCLFDCVVDADLAELKLLGGETSDTITTVLFDFASSIIPHGTKTHQQYAVGIGLSGPNRRFLKWDAKAGNGTASYGHGQILVLQNGIMPVSAAEMGIDVYGEVLGA